MRKLALAAALLFVCVVAVAAGAQPRIVNGTVTKVAASGDLAAQIRGSRTKFIGYAVPEAEGDRVMCCFESFGHFRSGGTCRLGSEQSYFTNNDKNDPSPASDVFAVLYTVADREITSVRSYSMDCRLDAAGAEVTWIDGANVRQSVALLTSVAGGEGHVADGATAALAMHAEPAATEALIGIARRGASSHARGRALFWLSQKAGEKAAGTIRDAVDNDPDSEVRNKAVFAVSQLPDDRSVPMLIDLMNHHRDRGVRKKAAFWLGQKHDPRALAAIEEMLRH